MDIERYLQNKAKLIDKTIEKYIPRSFSGHPLLFEASKPRYSHNRKALEKAISEPIWEFLDRGGKRWRPGLFLLICEALEADSEDLVDFAMIPEVIHNGTIMIDDVEDASLLRRGKPCTHLTHGLDIAINAGNAMYFLPLLPLILHKESILPSEKVTRIYETYLRGMINLSLGQAMDIAWHKGIAEADEIDERNYLQMCAYKTGTLARMAAEVAAILAGADSELIKTLGDFAESIGIAFQIQDDVLDFTSSQFSDKKGGLGQDITEGKRSLLVVRTLRVANEPDRSRLLAILKMHSSDEKLIKEAIALFHKYGSMEYAKEFARKMVSDSWAALEKHLPTSDAKGKLRAFADFMIERKI